MSQKTVLIVDDEEEILDLLSYSFEAEGFTVFTAQDGAEGLKQLSSHPEIAMVLTDINMPHGMDGFSFIEKMTTETKPGLPRPKVFAMTGYLNNVEKLEGRVDRFFTKPFLFDEIYPEIKNICGID